MKRFIEDYSAGTFDVIIIGGGISGAAVAYDAASRGLSVALLEKNDFGGATSAATSKLIHGGLRYLATGEVRLVRESLKERRILENIAPNFVYPIPIMITTNTLKFTSRKWVIRAGMILYDILSFDKWFTWDRSKRIPLHRSLSKKEVLKREPNVKPDGLTGASVYYDCLSIFPERLTLAFIKSAVAHGACVANYTEVVDFLFSEGGVAGVRVRDRLTGKIHDVRGDITVNCGGPWADIILGMAKREAEGEQLRRSEGIHIITRKLVKDHVVGSMTAKGRHYFIIPWRNHSLIGTTDKEYIGSPDAYRVTGQSIQELLNEINESFGDGTLGFKDILYTYGGLRPLVEDQTEEVYEASRKYEIYDHEVDGLNGLITVEGGKYTTSRNLAEHVVHLIGKKLGRKIGRTLTDKQFLAGCDIPDMESFIETIVKENPDFSRQTMEYLGRNYGTEYRKVLDYARGNPRLAEVLNEDGEILAEVVYAVREEMARSLSDVLFRRTGIGTLGDPGLDVLRRVAQTAARELGWTARRVKQELELVKKRFVIPGPEDRGEWQHPTDTHATVAATEKQTGKKSKKWRPAWIESPPPAGSYRSVFKWGNPAVFKHPNDRLYALMKDVFGMTDEDFRARRREGFEQVRCPHRVRLAKRHIAALKTIVGEQNVETNGYARVRYASGKTVEEAAKLRMGIVERVPDLVVHPRHKQDVKDIVTYCNRWRIPIYVYGGGSSVNFGLRPSKGGITLVLSTHMKNIIALNEENQTVRVQAGMMGPAYERALNNAPELLGARRRYTGGHFPQSFEYSSVGGWVVTLGSGQASSYYGDAYDLVIAQEYVTPTGTITTLEYPATATGPKVNDIMKGNEGTFGVLVELTMKVYRYMPENRRRFSWMFPTWEAAVNAAREISQGEFGFPAVFRISDPEETDVALKLYGIEGTILDAMMRVRGLRSMERCLMIGTAEGERRFARNVQQQVKRICKKFGAMYLTGYPVKKWEHGRYTDPYLREDLHDYGILIDTLETAVTWDNIMHLHQGVREFVKARPKTVCMTHGSHFYPQGTNLYFIFIARIEDIDEYIRFQEGIIEAIEKNGGSLSHHHGVGKMIGPWMERHLGKEQMAVLRALKKHFDPNNIMNPGGQMGLDVCTRKWRGIS